MEEITNGLECRGTGLKIDADRAQGLRDAATAIRQERRTKSEGGI
jgi:hypothetical protein